MRLFDAVSSAVLLPFIALSADAPPFHFVSYNRAEPPPGADGKPSPGGGIQDEKPVPISGITVDVPLPAGATLKGVQLIAPEAPEPRKLEASVENGRVRFVLPELFVYGVVQILFE